MPTPSALRVGRTRDGHRVLVEGRGTMRESPAVHEFAMQALEDDHNTLVIDLSACDYLDSTFLGCLVDLHRRHGRSRPPRFSVAAPAQARRRLLSSSHLDALLNVTAEAPEVLGEDVELPSQAPGAGELGRHVMECHRRLAELGGPDRAAFEAIADRFARELASHGAGPARSRASGD